jgi:UDP-glucuronate 4-epimerase
MGMTVLVTGAAGFIGSHLSAALLGRGHRVRALDAFIDYYPRTVKDGNVAGLLADPAFTFVEADLRTHDLLPAVLGCDVVVHAAAMPGLPMSWTRFDLYESCNVVATQRLAEAARTAGVGKLVYISTSSVYGASAVGDESMPTRPVSPYGVTKLAAEHLLAAYHESLELPVCVLRYFSVYGPRQRPDMAYHRFTEALLDGRPLTVFGTGEQSRSSTYVTDCVRATVGEVFNVGGGEVVTVLEAVDIIAGLLGTSARLEHAPPRSGDQRSTAADTAKARRVLGYVPRVDPVQGLTAQVGWHLARRARSAVQDMAG